LSISLCVNRVDLRHADLKTPKAPRVMTARRIRARAPIQEAMSLSEAFGRIG